MEDKIIETKITELEKKLEEVSKRNIKIQQEIRMKEKQFQDTGKLAFSLQERIKELKSLLAGESQPGDEPATK
jgi:hypothetical protein